MITKTYVLIQIFKKFLGLIMVGVKSFEEIMSFSFPN